MSIDTLNERMSEYRDAGLDHEENPERYPAPHLADFGLTPEDMDRYYFLQEQN